MTNCKRLPEGIWDSSSLGTWNRYQMLVDDCWYTIQLGINIIHKLRLPFLLQSLGEKLWQEKQQTDEKVVWFRKVVSQSN